MNYNELYRKKDRLKPKRTREERRNFGRIILAGVGSFFAGGMVMGLIVLIIYLLSR